MDEPPPHLPVAYVISVEGECVFPRIPMLRDHRIVRYENKRRWPVGPNNPKVSDPARVLDAAVGGHGSDRETGPPVFYNFRISIDLPRP